MFIDAPVESCCGTWHPTRQGKNRKKGDTSTGRTVCGSPQVRFRLVNKGSAHSFTMLQRQPQKRSDYSRKDGERKSVPCVVGGALCCWPLWAETRTVWSTRGGLLRGHGLLLLFFMCEVVVRWDHSYIRASFRSNKSLFVCV